MVDYITTYTNQIVDRSFDDSYKIESFFNKYRIFLIIEFNRLLVTWKKYHRLLLSIVTFFGGQQKQIATNKAIKKRVIQFVYNIEQM